ncbi:MAG: AraC-like DNA-binding protein [Polyangiales bacterium]
MPDPAKVLSDRDIEATNVRPAFEASLKFGLTEEELARSVGWTREQLEEKGTAVSGESTYLHMELMYGKIGYADFVLAATALHTAASLGVVGLAMKTASTVGEMMLCHQRFQHLTNRTAEYSTRLEDGALVLSEERHGEPRLGSRLISDYTLFVALQLLRIASVDAPKVVGMRSRRLTMNEIERRSYESFLGASIELGAPRAELVLNPSIRECEVATADAELAAYFRDLLENDVSFSDHEPELLRDARLAIRDALVLGTPTATMIARTLGFGQRTLQRRLAQHEQSFAKLLESTRRMLAEGYLKNHQLSIAEIGYLLGYSEQASFFRAFRGWYGATPAAYRRERGDPNSL